jgi:hypothetical protein
VVGCFGTAGCHKATFPQPMLWRASSVTTADLYWEEQSHLAPDMGAVCAATVDNKARDGSVFSNDFSTKDRLAWMPWIHPPAWYVQVPRQGILPWKRSDVVRLLLAKALDEAEPPKKSRR